MLLRSMVSTLCQPADSVALVCCRFVYLLSSVKSIRFSVHIQSKAVIAHACHEHTLQLSAGLSVWDSRLVVSNNPVRGKEMFYLTTHSTHFIYGYMT